MAQERKISTNLDLTIDEAVTEYIELQVYLKSEKWVYSVTEKIERRMADLAKLVIEKLMLIPKDKIESFAEICETWGPNYGVKSKTNS